MQRSRNKSEGAIKKTISTGRRYIRNIAQTKQFAKDVEDFNNGLTTARKREYSQNTYMGQNKG